ncbi:MAG: hypothetical protein AUI33_13275 [Ignavibacteria bacterium 13_1_40CM_2_61_4]|nr:MAG: hypothetical protein AUI33_13275 [Ignavibacteria bacterium 13_1_40CM_2_61_4]
MFKWDGKEDALLTVALEVVRDVFNENQKFAWDLKPLFRLQMAYLLLWSAIERYASLRYHLGVDVTKKIRQLAEEPSFQTALQQFVKQEKRVYRADRPKENYRLDPTNSSESLDFYYQIRSNITHRGKAVPDDFDLLKDSLFQLSQIFDCVLESAFAEAKASNTS